MAVTRRFRASSRTTRKSRRRTASTTRRGGAYGVYRGTRAMGALRVAARRYRSMLNPFPNSRLVRHKYVDTFTLPAGGTVGAASIYQFRANSVYDPDLTGVGHQPLFHDEMAAQYKRYTVMKSTIVLEAAGTNAQELNFVLWVDDDTTTPGTLNPTTVMEQHRSKLDRLDRRSYPLKIKGWYDAAKWHKTTRKGLIADDLQRTQVGSNPSPSAEKYFTLYVAPLSGLVTLQAIPMKVTLYYETLWQQPVDHVGS